MEGERETGKEVGEEAERNGGGEGERGTEERKRGKERRVLHVANSWHSF